MNVGLNRIYLKRAEFDLISGFVHRVVAVVVYLTLKSGKMSCNFKVIPALGVGQGFSGRTLTIE